MMNMFKNPLFHSPLIGLALMAWLIALVFAGPASAQMDRSWFADKTNGIAAPPPKITWAEFNHQVYFRPGRARIEGIERDRLHAFIVREGLGQGNGDKAFVVAQPNFSSVKADKLAVARERAIRRFLLPHQVYPGTLAGDPRGAPVNAGGPDAVTIVVRRPVVVAQPCKDWDRAMSGRELMGEKEAFGCLTARALRAQVANPQDLIQGREAGPADGNVAGAAIDRYRTDKVKKLNQQDTGSGAGGSN